MRAEFAGLPVWYEGPLPFANMQARLYLYAYMVHLDHVEALTWPLPRLDALHTWDEALAYELLCRLMLPLAHLASLEHGQPTSRSPDPLLALRPVAAPAAAPPAAPPPPTSLPRAWPADEPHARHHPGAAHVCVPRGAYALGAGARLGRYVC